MKYVKNFNANSNVKCLVKEENYAKASLKRTRVIIQNDEMLSYTCSCSMSLHAKGTL